MYPQRATAAVRATLTEQSTEPNDRVRIDCDFIVSHLSAGDRDDEIASTGRAGLFRTTAARAQKLFTYDLRRCVQIGRRSNLLISLRCSSNERVALVYTRALCSLAVCRVFVPLLIVRVGVGVCLFNAPAIDRCAFA